MGSNGSRVLQISNIQQHIDNFQILGQKNCPIYGVVDCVNYKGMDFNVAQSMSGENPHPRSIHYLVKPNYLIFPQFQLLEGLAPSSLTFLLNIIQGICEMAIEGVEAGRNIGVGYNRIAFKDRWGVVGQLSDDWAFEKVYEHNDPSGVFFSPQQMIALSQPRSAKYDVEKADVFALGIMLVEIIFQEDLDHIYDYQNFEIKLNPLLAKLQSIKAEFGEEVASLFIGMLEIQEEDRFDFQQALEMVNELIAPPPSRPSLNMLNSNGSQRPLELSRGRKPNQNVPYTKTPKNSERAMYRNDVSPFRGRFGNTVKNNAGVGSQSRRSPMRGQESRSPMRRNNNRQQFQPNQQRISPMVRR